MKTKLLAIVFVVALLLSGCNSVVKNTREDGVKMTGIDAWEMELLCETYKSKAEQNRIRSGELYEYQKKTLDNLRNVCAYLEEKYPQNKITITKIEPKEMMRSYATFRFTVEGFEGTYAVLIDLNEELTDNFYAELIGPEYDSVLTEMLKSEGINVVCVRTYFDLSLGEKYNGEMSVEEIFEADKECPRTTTVFVRTDDGESVATKIKELFADIYGYYFVDCSDLFIEGLTWDEYELIMKNEPKNIQRFSFNVE